MGAPPPLTTALRSPRNPSRSLLSVPYTAPSTRWTHAQGWFRSHRPEILLVSLAITIPELLTGSTPVWDLLDPLSLLGLLGFYGAGVLLVRDLATRWRKGWSGVLLLGLAYGVAEEAIATKTAVDPGSSAAALLATYGHFAGVSWDWLVVISVFHAVFSIALPILIVELAYPGTQGSRFLSDKGLRYALLVLGTSVTLGYLAFVPGYFPGDGVLAFLLGLIATLVFAAYRLPTDWLLPQLPVPTRSPRFFLAVGALFGVGWVFFDLVADHLTSLAFVPALGEVLLCLGVARAVRRTIGRGSNELHKVYFVAGLLSWYLFWDVIVTFLGDYLVLAVLAAVYYLVLELAREHRPTTEVRGAGQGLLGTSAPGV